MQNPQPEKYVPIPEELVGESYAYCYGQQPWIAMAVTFKAATPDIEDGYYTDLVRYADPQ